MTAWDPNKASGNGAEGAVERALNDYLCGERTFEGLLAAIDRLIAEHDGHISDLSTLIRTKCEEINVPEFVQHSLLERCGPEHATPSQTRNTRASHDSTIDRDETTEFSQSFAANSQAVVAVSTPLPVAASLDDFGPELPRPGAVLNHRYELIRCVGAGGSSNVYKALDRRKLLFDDPFPYVAVKVLNRRYRTRPDWPEALRREAARCQQLHSPNIVKVFDVLRDGPVVYIVMEYLSGAPLTQTIRTENFTGLPAEEAVEIINTMGRALDYAHSQSIIHCDFKPANVFLTQEHEIKLIDFGIARMMTDGEPSSLPSQGTALELFEQHAVTPAYASPELLERGDPDPRDDVFSLACTAYELLTGTHPYDFRPATVARDERLIVQRRKGLSRIQWKALRRALALTRAERTPTIADFLSEFNGVPKIQPVFLRAAAVILTISGVVWLYTNYRTTDAIRLYVGDRLTVFGAKLKGDHSNEIASVGNKAGSGAIDSSHVVTPLSSEEGVFKETRVQPLPAAESIAAAEQSVPAGPGESDNAAPSNALGETDVVPAAPASRLETLIKKADQQIDSDQLVSSSGPSALSTYREILNLDPTNAKATAGLETLRSRLVERFATALKDADIVRARQILQDMRSTAPDFAALDKFTDELAVVEKRQIAPHTETIARKKELARPILRSMADRKGVKASSESTAVVAHKHEESDPEAIRKNDSGLKAIADRLKERAIVKQRQGELLESQALVAEGLRVQPAHSGLQRLREALEHEIQSKAAQRVEPESFAVRSARPESSSTRDKAESVTKDSNFNFGTF